MRGSPLVPPDGGRIVFPSLPRGVRFLLLANGGVWAFVFLSSLASPSMEALLVDLFGFRPSRIFHLPPFLWQFATAPFLHAGLGHLLLNLLFLFLMGPFLEEMWGTRRFLRVYASGALLGCVGQLLYALVIPGVFDVPMIGASGALLALLVCAAVLHPNQPVRLFPFIFQIPLWVLAGIMVLLDLVPILKEFQAGMPLGGTSHAGHLGGALAGFVMARWGGSLAPAFESVEHLPSRLRERRAIAASRRESEARRRMDNLLAKIAEKGIGSLSRSEKSFLNRTSRRLRDRQDPRA